MLYKNYYLNLACLKGLFWAGLEQVQEGQEQERQHCKHPEEEIGLTGLTWFLSEYYTMRTLEADQRHDCEQNRH